MSPAETLLLITPCLLQGRRQWHPTPVLLPGKSHGWRSLVGCSPWGHQELDMTERLHFHFPLSFIGEGNGNPLQCSCLENPRDGGAWWAAVHGFAQSRTRLKQLSSSSSSSLLQASPVGLWFSPGAVLLQPPISSLTHPQRRAQPAAPSCPPIPQTCPCPSPVLVSALILFPEPLLSPPLADMVLVSLASIREMKMPLLMFGSRSESGHLAPSWRPRSLHGLHLQL